MTVARLETLQDRLHLVGVVGPEVPLLVELVERRVREHDDRRLGRHLGKSFSASALGIAHRERALTAGVVELGHGQHPLLRRHLRVPVQ
jgi:hypothetical protein